MMPRSGLGSQDANDRGFPRAGNVLDATSWPPAHSGRRQRLDQRLHRQRPSWYPDASLGRQRVHGPHGALPAALTALTDQQPDEGCFRELYAGCFSRGGFRMVYGQEPCESAAENVIVTESPRNNRNRSAVRDTYVASCCLRAGGKTSSM